MFYAGAFAVSNAPEWTPPGELTRIAREHLPLGLVILAFLERRDALRGAA